MDQKQREAFEKRQTAITNDVALLKNKTTGGYNSLGEQTWKDVQEAVNRIDQNVTALKLDTQILLAEHAEA